MTMTLLGGTTLVALAVGCGAGASAAATLPEAPPTPTSSSPAPPAPAPQQVPYGGSGESPRRAGVVPRVAQAEEPAAADS